MSDVLTLLDGLRIVSDSHDCVRGSETDTIYPVRSFRFACGCVASHTMGWASCNRGLHGVLAVRGPDSRATRHVRSLRPVFDAVLAEAWRRRGTHPDHFYQFHVDRQREPVTFEEWQRTHDLAQHEIWQDGNLEAALDKVSSERIVLFNSGHTDNVTIRLLWSPRSGHDFDLPANITSAIATVFGRSS